MPGKRVLKYIELKTGYNDDGPAWIARVRLSKSGQSLYFGSKALKKAAGGLGGGNYLDIRFDSYNFSCNKTPLPPVRDNRG